MPIIESIQTGRIRTEGDAASSDIASRLWTSAFDKRTVTGPVTVTPLGISGDEVADTKHHGGVDKAILCYAASHYRHWAETHPEIDWRGGALGENLTLGDADETSVCIGDQYASADCRFEVSQPRQPCWKISRRWADKTLTKAVTQTGRTGWYLRVLEGGTLAVGETLRLVHRPHPEWTVARANDVLFGREVDRASVIALMAIPELAQAWKSDIA